MTTDTARLAAAAGAILLYLAFCVLIVYRELRKRKREAARAGETLPANDGFLIAFASQTGFAEQLAWQTADSLRTAGVPVQVSPLGKLNATALAGCSKALFVVSTTGEGDAPDSAAGFTRKVMGASAALHGLRYGLLALGDRAYPQYCAFGYALDHWLRRHGAEPFFDLVDVDNSDEGALRHWQHQLGVLSGNSAIPDWSTPVYREWTLSHRLLLNAGSPGGGVFHIALRPPEEGMTWQAGDVAEVGPRNPTEDVLRVARLFGLHPSLALNGDGGTLGDLLSRSVLPQNPEALQELAALQPEELPRALTPLPHREYSIASLPADGRLDLLVRQMCHPDGRLGLGSGWLTEHAPLHGPIALRIRENRAFHSPPDDRPLILIGNGTGLAGLRAHLKARAAAGCKRNWLLFGERTAAHDFFHREEIERWQSEGILQRVDLAFSRDQAERIYVQDRLREAAEAVRAWVRDGASIYVCGSLEGMAGGVSAALTDILGADTLEQLAEDGRYRRDVY